MTTSEEGNARSSRVNTPSSCENKSQEDSSSGTECTKSGGSSSLSISSLSTASRQGVLKGIDDDSEDQFATLSIGTQSSISRHRQETGAGSKDLKGGHRVRGGELKTKGRRENERTKPMRSVNEKGRKESSVASKLHDGSTSRSATSRRSRQGDEEKVQGQGLVKGLSQTRLRREKQMSGTGLEKEQKVSYRGLTVERDDCERALRSELLQWKVLQLQADIAYEEGEEQVGREMVLAWEELSTAYEERRKLTAEVKELKSIAIEAAYDMNCLPELEKLVKACESIQNKWMSHCQAIIEGTQYVQVQGVVDNAEKVQRALMDFRQSVDCYLRSARKEGALASAASSLRKLLRCTEDPHVADVGRARDIVIALTDQLACKLCSDISAVVERRDAEVLVPPTL